MARTRLLKPDFFKDEDLAEKDFWVRILFAGLWVLADKAGRLKYSPKRIKAEIFPYDLKIDIEKGLQELSKIKSNNKNSFIKIYKVEGETYIQIIQWDKHQHPHHTEVESLFPDPINANTDTNAFTNTDTLYVHKVNNPLHNGSLTVKEQKAKFMEFVLMTDAEHLKLLELFGVSATNEWISKLNDYIGSTGKKYKSHFHTIMNWSRKDKESLKARPTQSQINSLATLKESNEAEMVVVHE